MGPAAGGPFTSASDKLSNQVLHVLQVLRVRRVLQVRGARGVLSVCLLALVTVATGLRAEIIDRILAVVQGNIITLSDVTAARRLGLVVVPQTGDPVGASMERLIDRTLMLIEVDRYSPPEPAEAAIEARFRDVRARFASQAEFEGVLAASGMTVEQLRRHVRDDLLLTAYLDQRFGATLQPSDDEVLQYYREHPGEFSRGGTLQPFSEVSADARAKLIAERRASLIAEWIAGLRRRAEVNVLYLPGKR